MSNTDTIVILIAFAAYLVLMIVIGAIYMKNTNNSEDYFLGGRGLSGWVAALSAQASDMSGWLLMGLPLISDACADSAATQPLSPLPPRK